MSEAALWSMTKSRLARYGALHRIENSIDVGTGDVIYCLRPSPIRRASTGWLELKHLPAWPIGLQTPVVIDHLTREQVLFAKTWAAAGGNAHMLLQVRRTYLLAGPDVMAAIYKRQLTKVALMAVASVVSQDLFPTRRIVGCLTR